MQVSMSLIQERIPASCHYDPLRWAPHDWEGTHQDILEEDDIPIPDRIFIVFHLISEGLRREFAIRSARVYQEKFSISDSRVTDSIAVAEAFLIGTKSEEELSQARASVLSFSRETQNQGAFITAKAAARACSLPVMLPHIDPACAEQLLQSLFELTEGL